MHHQAVLVNSEFLTHIGLICDQLGPIYSVIATYGLKHVCFVHLRNDLRNIYQKIMFFHPSPFPWGNSCPGNCISWCREGRKQLYNWGQQGFATKVSFQVFNDQVGHVFPGLFRGTCNMRHQHHIVELKQLFRNMRFLLKNIKPCPT